MQFVSKPHLNKGNQMTSKEKYDFVKNNHKSFAMGGLSNKECCAETGLSQGRISQLVKAIKEAEAKKPAPVTVESSAEVL